MGRFFNCTGTGLAGLLLDILILLSIFSCQDSGVPEGYLMSEDDMYLDVSDYSNLKFNANGGTGSFKVNAENVDWKISNVPAWFTTNPSKGNESAKVTVSVSENSDTGEGRIGVFSVRSDMEDFNRERKITVTQERAMRYAVPEIDRVEFSGGEGSENVNVRSNSVFTTSIIEGSDWMSVVSGNNSIYIYVSENRGYSLRTGRIALSTSDQTNYIDVVQRLANVDVSTSELSFGCKGGSYRVRVDSEVGWVVYNSMGWINVEPESALLYSNAEDTCFTLTALPNLSAADRIGYIYVSAGAGNLFEIPVIQKGLTFDIIDNDNNNINKLIFSQTGSQKVRLESNVSWHVNLDSLPDWIFVDPVHADGSTSIIVNVEEHYDTIDRSGNILFVADELPVARRLEIVQLGRFFKGNGGTLNVGSKPSSWGGYFISNDEWTVKMRPHVDWIEYDDSVMFGTGSFNFRIADNPSVNSRHVFMDFCSRYSFDTITVYVLQDGRYLDLSEESVVFFTKGGYSGNIVVSTDGAVQVEVMDGSDWLSASYDTTGIATLYATANDTDSLRSGKVAFRLTDLIDGELVRYVNVSQAYTDFIFNKKDYSDDRDLNLGTSGEISLSVSGYEQDLDLNGLYETGSATSVSRESYQDDIDENGGLDTDSSVENTGYPDENNLEESGGDVDGSGINISNYGNDTDLN